MRGIRDVLDVALVRPELVAEVGAGTAVGQGGVFGSRSASNGGAWG
ncbi:MULTISPECIES: hypothetical protein [unclassified Streptomyces]|nr:MULTISPECIES: hypothetical protein [unclassified Streptomyces]